MQKLRVLELFAGLGACSKALERLNIPHEIVDAVEIDKYAINSFNAIHGTNFEPQDITMWDKDIDVDLIMHGSPCQDFSLAGKQAGGDEGSGTRSSLMYETIRIVKKLKPKYVVWENVKNLLSKKHKHNFDAYLETMEKLGYKNYYQVLNAKDYGVPQNRERVFTISILGNDNYNFPKGHIQDCEIINPLKDISGKSWQFEQNVYDANGILRSLKAGGGSGNIPKIIEYFQFPQKQPLKLKLKDLLEDKVDEKYYLSDKQVNRIRQSTYTQNQRRIQEKEYCDTLCARDWKDPKCVEVNGDIYSDESVKRIKSNIIKSDVANTLTANGMQSFNHNNCALIEEGYVEKKYREFIDENGYIPEMYNPYNNSEIKDIAPTQSTQCGSTTSSATVLKTEYKSVNKSLKETLEINKIGNEEVQYIDAYNRTIKRDGLAKTITTRVDASNNDYILIKNNTKQGYLEATDGDGINISSRMKYQRGNVQKESIQTLTTSGGNDRGVLYNLRIRKLTPKECFRLMGFDDEDFDKAQNVPTSNSQLYKQAGNSIVVNVLEAIFKELFKDYIPSEDKWEDLD